MTADIYSCYAGEVTSMNKITSSEFQSNYQRLDEPVVVMARSRTLGTWYPKGTEDVPVMDPQSPDEWIKPEVWQNEVLRYEAEIKYLKSELAKRLTTKVETFAPATAVRATVRNGGFGHSTPAPKP
jgi:hypothetical protein